MLWSVAGIIVTVTLGILIGWGLRTRPLDQAPPLFFNGRNISLDMTLLSVDPLANGGTITVSWSVIHDNCMKIRGPNGSCPVVDIYLDE